MTVITEFMKPILIYSLEALFSLIILTIFNELPAQVCESIQKQETNGISILNNRVQIQLKNGLLKKLKKERLLRQYSREFGISRPLCTDGFQLAENVMLRFYKTEIDNPGSNDSGLSTWKPIQLFTEKIPRNQWIESGWKRVNRSYIYFVKVASPRKRGQFFEFFFFNIDEKLTFGVFQCPIKALDDWQTFISEFGNNLRILLPEEQASRFTGL